MGLFLFGPWAPFSSVNFYWGIVGNEGIRGSIGIDVNGGSESPAKTTLLIEGLRVIGFQV